MFGSEQGVVPEPPVEGRLEQERCEALYRDLRDPTESVSWRTLIVELADLLGSADPAFEPVEDGKFNEAFSLVKWLLKDTGLELLDREVLHGLGFEERLHDTGEKLDVLLVNARHGEEPVLAPLLVELRDRGLTAATFNVVDRYNDDQHQIVGPECLYRDVDKVCFVASTQIQQGSDVEVLTRSLRWLRQLEVMRRIGSVDLVMPMFGGSRGHRQGQASWVGFEALQVKTDPKIVLVFLKDELKEVVKEVGVRIFVPGDSYGRMARKLVTKSLPIKVVTVDIHNEFEPRETIAREGIGFESAKPELEFAQAVNEVIKEKNLSELPVAVVSSDKGSEGRTERLAGSLLGFLGEGTVVDIIYMDKFRKRAGEVDKVEFRKVRRLTLRGGRVGLRDLSDQEVKEAAKQGCVLVYCDDMIDTGGTAKGDKATVESLYRQQALTIFVASHAVFSKGVKYAVEKIDADVYLLSNTLLPRDLRKLVELEEMKRQQQWLGLMGAMFDKELLINPLFYLKVLQGKVDVRVVDAAPAIVRALYN